MEAQWLLNRRKNSGRILREAGKTQGLLEIHLSQSKVRGKRAA